MLKLKPIWCAAAVTELNDLKYELQNQRMVICELHETISTLKEDIKGNLEVITCCINLRVQKINFNSKVLLT